MLGQTDVGTDGKCCINHPFCSKNKDSYRIWRPASKWNQITDLFSINQQKIVMYSLYMVLTSREPQHTLLNTSVWLQVSANYIVWQQLSASTLVGRKVTLEVAELLVPNIWYFRNCWSSGILPTKPSLKLARYLRENPSLMPAVTGA